jgi:hypothetical protein
MQQHRIKNGEHRDGRYAPDLDVLCQRLPPRPCLCHLVIFRGRHLFFSRRRLRETAADRIKFIIHHRLDLYTTHTPLVFRGGRMDTVGFDRRKTYAAWVCGGGNSAVSGVNGNGVLLSQVPLCIAARRITQDLPLSTLVMLNQSAVAGCDLCRADG